MSKFCVLLALFLFSSMASVQAAQTWPNEPDGSTLLSDHDFSTLNGGSPIAWVPSYPQGGAIIDDPSEGQVPSKVYKFWWFHNQPNGNSAVPNLVFPEKSELYIGFTWKPSNPFTGWSNLFNKMVAVLTTGGGSAWCHGLHSRTVQGGPYYTDLYLSTAGDNSHLPNNGVLTGGTEVQLGVWHRVEIYYKRSTTPTSRDGIARLWLDGALQASVTNANFSGGFKQIQFTPSWDSAEPNYPNAYDEHRIGHVRVSAPNGAKYASDQPPGPPASPRILNVTVQ